MSCDGALSAEVHGSRYKGQGELLCSTRVPPVTLCSPAGQPEVHILVVEDDSDDFLLVSELLRSEMPAETDQAVSVDDAARKVERSTYDVILLDYALGANTGLDLLAEFERHEVRTPVVFLTGHGDEQVAVRAWKAGAVDYLSKAGLTASALATAVRHALALREKDQAVRDAREALSAREREYRMLFENANDAIVIFDPETEEILAANPAAGRLYDCPHMELVGTSLIEVSTDIVKGRAAIEACLRAGTLSNCETVHVTRTGRNVFLLANLSIVDYRERHALLGVFRDVSERKAAEQEIFRLNRALKALSKSGQALLHARDQQELLEEICHIVVEVGGYRMAWVAAAPEPSDNCIRPLASYGASSDYVETLCLRYNASMNSSLLVPTALRTSQPAVCRDTETDPRSASLRAECRQRGFASIIALPLKTEGVAFGALAIYAAERDAFDAAEVELLSELAANVSFGVESLLARTQKETAEDELRRSEARLRNLIETANEGIWTIDDEDRTTFVNAKMATILGRAADDVIGRNVMEFIHPSQREVFRLQDRRKSARGHYEALLVRGDGTSIVTSLNSTPLFDDHGGYEGALAMVTDITDQKQAEQRLRDSEKRYRTLFERNLAGVFRARADATLIEVNDAFLRMLGYEHREELIDQKLTVLCAAAGFVDSWGAELSAAGQLINREMRVLRKDGSTACLLANLILLRDGAETPATIEGTVLDITERRQLEAQLLQSQKMEAIGRLAGGIAHDFNNLLMVIRSYAELGTENGSEESVRHGLDAILKAADRGACLTKQLLTFSRKQVFSPRVLDINAVLENITKVLPRALGEDVRVELRAGAELWQVKADPTQIEQLVLNLAVNARDAMPGGGRLILETCNTVLDNDYVKLHAGVVPGDYVMVAVSDTGQGIAPENLPHIFEPFFTTKERGKGTGLGLATVYGIVQQSGGFVWVYSELGEGTVFKIYLPRVGAVEVTPAPAVDDCAPVHGTGTILLVEDEEAVRRAAKTYLTLRGYTVLEAGCGEEALRVCDEHADAIDLLITDAVMPGMSGTVLAAEICKRRPQIHIIYMSGYTEATVGERSMIPDAAFLQKPFSLAALGRQVRQSLRARERESQQVA